MGASDVEFEWLFREEFPAIHRTVFLICNDEEQARDITQEAFVQLLRHWKSVSRYERPGAWVRRVAIRLTMQSLRRERLRAVLERDVDIPVTQTPADVDLLHAIADLPPKQRAATVLFYYEDMPLADVAQVLGCSGATARVHVRRARIRLSAALGEEVSDDVG